MELRNFTRALSLLAAAAILVLPLAVQAAPPGGGGGNKVSVTAANPADAFQGEELDVIVSGSGFDQGSQVSYLVTGTTDGSQVDVLSVEFISSSELKTRVRPKESALPAEYDIEVRASSGRKGKGTTLFRVKQNMELTCTGLEDPSPTIAYLSELVLSPDLGTSDFYLASDSGCDQYLLLEKAKETVFTADGFVEISSPFQLKVDYEALPDTGIEQGFGVAIWRNISRTHGSPVILALTYAFDGVRVLVDTVGPRILYAPPDDWRPYGADIRIDDGGTFELAVVEKPQNSDASRLVYVDVDRNVREVLLEGECPIRDSTGTCYGVENSPVWWDENGSEVYFKSFLWPDWEREAIARIRRTDDGWQTPEILMTSDGRLSIDGVRSDGVLSYGWNYVEIRKSGKPGQQQFASSIIDPDICVLDECTVFDGEDVPVPNSSWPNGRWTRDGGYLYIDYEGNLQFIRKYEFPLTGEEALFPALGPINNLSWEYDTSY